MERRVGKLVRGEGSQGGWGGGSWVEAIGTLGADGSSGAGLFWGRFLKADTHNTGKCSCVLGFAILSFSLVIVFSFWLKCTRREEPVSQRGLSKQVRDRQHSSEVFSFPFYRGDLHRTHKKKKHTSERKSDNTKKTTTGSPSLIQKDCVISDSYSG